MSYEETIEGLEKFHNRILKTNLSYHIWESEMMSVVEALNLLKSQKAEIERLTAMVEAAEDYLNPLPFKNAYDEATEKAKTEAYKEFAESSKDKLIKLYEKYHTIALAIKDKETSMFYQGRAEAIWECISKNDNLLAEMENKRE